MTRSKGTFEDAPTMSRPLPRRRVPVKCSGSSLGHYWLIGAYLAASKAPAVTGFFERHVKRAGLVWYACKFCGWGDCVTEDRLPMPGCMEVA